MNRAREFFISMFLTGAFAGGAAGQQPRGTLIVSVRSESQPVEQAEVQVGHVVALTNARGEAVLELPPGEVEVAVRRFGFAPRSARATIQAGATRELMIELGSARLSNGTVITPGSAKLP